MVSRARATHNCQKRVSSLETGPTNYSKLPACSYLRKHRKDIKARKQFPLTIPSLQPFTIGSVNIQGMNYQSAWAIQQNLDKN